MTKLRIFLISGIFTVFYGISILISANYFYDKGFKDVKLLTEVDAEQVETPPFSTVDGLPYVDNYKGRLLFLKYGRDYKKCLERNSLKYKNLWKETCQARERHDDCALNWGDISDIHEDILCDFDHIIKLIED